MLSEPSASTFITETLRISFFCDQSSSETVSAERCLPLAKSRTVVEAPHQHSPGWDERSKITFPVADQTAILTVVPLVERMKMILQPDEILRVSFKRENPHARSHHGYAQDRMIADRCADIDEDVSGR
jgi:hypothetical protein